jgi:hypothetical protein
VDSVILPGVVGVALLLLAFGLNLGRRLSARSPFYLGLNVVGAGLAGWYAWLDGALPFVALEGVWSIVALVRLIGVMRKAPSQQGERP